MSMSEDLILFGIVTIFIGFLLVLIGGLLQAKSKTEFAFVGFIGPFPIGFGTSKKIVFIGLLISFIAILTLLLLTRKL